MTGIRPQTGAANISTALIACLAWAGILLGSVVPRQAAADLPIEEVEGQPLAAQVQRLVKAMEFLGRPLPKDDALLAALAANDAEQIQRRLDSHAVLMVSVNPEVRVKVSRGPAQAAIQQGGFTPLLVKVVNHSTVTRQLRVHSPQAGRSYGGASNNSLARQRQTELNQGAATKAPDPNRAVTPAELQEQLRQLQERPRPFLDVEMFQDSPLTRNLSGLEVEYVVMMIASSQAGKREATIGFDVGAGTQDIGFRGEAPLLLDVQPAVAVQLDIRDDDGAPTTARLEFRDAHGRVYPPQSKRVAPDFFFQPQVYRHHGETVLLPPGDYTCAYSRGPEYLVRQSRISVAAPAAESPGAAANTIVPIRLKRWVAPMDFGFYSGDHHIHGAGCAHYTSPTLGVTPSDMFRQVKGEGLNVGCVLTWGPCFEFQRQYFSPKADNVSERMTVLKYDLEISGFGSAALGHVCLLNLKSQTYPGSEGAKTKAWPTWTVPVLRWCKEQGGVTGYPHSAMHINPAATAKRMLARDRNHDNHLSALEANDGLLPASFAQMDRNRDQVLTAREIELSVAEAAEALPNFVVPEMNGAGAMEIFVSVPAGVCDFISAMDTERVQEWNTWYHLLNCGFPLKLSGETDFPCMSSRRVGQGRVYVQLGRDTAKVDFTQWCEGLAAGRSYVSDGYAHALTFKVEGVSPGGQAVEFTSAGDVAVEAAVSFAEETPKGVAYGTEAPIVGGRSRMGDTRELHAHRSARTVRGGRRLVELVVNGQVAASQWVPADGQLHTLRWSVPVERSSWIALRQFPQLHTNPVDVVVAKKPIRVSKQSAQWCIDAVKLLWKNRHTRIHVSERTTAKAAYDAAIEEYNRRLLEME